MLCLVQCSLAQRQSQLALEFVEARRLAVIITTLAGIERVVDMMRELRLEVCDPCVTLCQLGLEGDDRCAELSGAGMTGSVLVASLGPIDETRGGEHVQYSTTT